MVCRIYEWFGWETSGLGGIRVVSVVGEWFEGNMSGLGGI